VISKEKELFEFIKGKFIPDLKNSDDKFSKYDCYSEQFKLDIELKCRQKHYDDLLIEKSKYKYLVSRAERFKTKAFYINSTPNGVYVFNLSGIEEPIWEERRMPKTSHFSNRDKIIKEVGYINISNAKEIYEQV
tara:strand:- start:387 stop:788 length:402 start_codon:yes stop_codon:yes gene_type:complete